MSNIKVTVQDANNVLLEVTPVPIQQIAISRGVAGRGIDDVQAIEIDNALYLEFFFTDGTTEIVGPVGTIQYIGESPIVVEASTISLDTVPISFGGTGAITASGARTNLGLGTIATQDASAVAITGGSITGITDLAVADGGTGASTAAGAMVNLLPSYTGNANKRLSLDSTASGLEWVTDGGGTVTSVDVSGGTTGLSFTGGPITTSGTITLSGTLDVDNGGTGATTAAGARTNLNAADQALTLTAGTGLSGGGDLTANRSFSIANTGVTAASYGAASKTLTATVNAQGQLTALADTDIAISNTQISGLGTMSTQNANAVAITGGSITGITDLAVADGGTGASDASGARTNLGAAASATTISAGTGLSGGGDLTANRTLSIANTAVTAGSYGTASDTLTATVNAQGQLTALAATPIAISNTQISGLGTMSTQNSNSVTITGGSITGITDLAIADGGTGASTASGARSNLGLGTAAVLDAGVANGVATLDAGGTVPLSQIPASIQGGVSYQGAWNASTNTPTLTSSVGTKGHYYVVSVAGNTNLNGVTDWLVGDWAIYNGTAWEKIDNTDQVASVNGYTGVVVLTNTDVGAPPTSLTISAGTGLSGGGNLTTNRTLSIANTAVSAGSYGTASAVPSFTVNGQGQLTAASDVTIAISNTQVSGLGTMSTQNANSVAITGGSITGITDLAIADGGTGASTAGGALTNLGAIGTITSTDGSIVVTPSGTTVDLAVSAASPASTLLTQVRNTTGATLTKGTVVYISGATGQIATVSKAIATGDATSAQTLGMITSDLANNSNGYVTVFGLLEDIDTSSYTDGAQLYLSGTTAGAVTATKPSAPTHLVYVAVVEYAHPTQGKLLVKVQNGYELDEIHDVSIVSPTTGQTLVYSASTDLWSNSNAPVISGTTINNTTIGATTASSGAFTTLSASSNVTLSGGTANGVLYLNGSKQASSGSALTFDGNQIAVTPASGNAVSKLFGGTGTGVGSYFAVYAQGANSGYFGTDSGVTGSGTSNDLTIYPASTNNIRFYQSGAEQMRLTSTGLGIGTSSPSSKLDIVGVTQWQATAGTVLGKLTYSGGEPVVLANTGLGLQFFTNNAFAAKIDSSGNLGIGTSSPASKLHVSGAAAKLYVDLGGNNYYQASNQIWQNYGGGTEYMRLDSAGNLGIGTSSPATQLDVASNTGTEIVTRRNGGRTVNTYADAVNAILAYSTGALRIGETTSTVGANFTERMRLDSAGNVGIGGAAPSGQRLYVVGGQIWHASNQYNVSPGSGVDYEMVNRSGRGWLFYTNDANNFGANITQYGLGLGNTVSGSGMGIAFPATQDASSNANTLDDYEEGTWTFAVTTTGGSVTMTSGLDDCYYIKIGRLVTVGGQVTVNSVSSPTGAIVVSLPFAGPDLTETAEYPSGSIYIGNSVSKNANDFALLKQDVQEMRIYIADVNLLSSSNANAQQLQAGTIISFQLSYYASA